MLCYTQLEALDSDELINILTCNFLTTKINNANANEYEVIRNEYDVIRNEYEVIRNEYL